MLDWACFSSLSFDIALLLLVQNKYLYHFCSLHSSECFKYLTSLLILLRMAAPSFSLLYHKFFREGTNWVPVIGFSIFLFSSYYWRWWQCPSKLCGKYTSIIYHCGFIHISVTNASALLVIHLDYKKMFQFYLQIFFPAKIHELRALWYRLHWLHLNSKKNCWKKKSLDS